MPFFCIINIIHSIENVSDKSTLKKKTMASMTAYRFLNVGSYMPGIGEMGHHLLGITKKISKHVRLIISYE